MAISAKGITITKLDAARRQLRTAIILWFRDGDPVAIHTLAFAAYEIIHFVSKKRNRLRDLLFDSLVIEDQYRKEFGIFIKRHANFFKHANKDVDDVIEFRPVFSEPFILFALLGIELCGERLNAEESAFFYWTAFHRPRWISAEGRKRLEDRITVERAAQIRTIPRSEFLQVFQAGRKMRR
jgi:hypothetical protein